MRKSWVGPSPRVVRLEILLWILVAACAAAAQSVRVEGTVRDSTGAAVAGAQVALRAGSGSASRVTDAHGSFIFDSVTQNSGTVTVRAEGFATAQQSWSAGAQSSANLQIVLSPAGVNQEVVVTATRVDTRLSDVAGSAVVLNSQDIASTPALLVDDKLREIPGFTLFRRSGSRTANPTSQGVSLGGLGASGASRALVLEDGIPLNDPFGGWVYWGRVPQQALASVEVVRGGVSSLYGSNALGGVIQFLSRQENEQKAAIKLETSYSSEETPDLSFWAGTSAGPWDAALATDLFRTDGYVLVPVAQRGAVDTPANAEHATLDLTVGRRIGEHSRVFGRGSFFREARNNGTPIQTNDTILGQGAVGADTQLDGVGSLSVRLYGDAQGYNQNFSSIAPDRMSESLTNMQHVPAQQMGGSAQWSRPLGRSQSLVAGVDAKEVMGWSHESIFSSGNHIADSISGGRQRTAGFYGEDIVRLGPKWTITAGARLDHWRNFDAQSLRTPVSASTPPVFTPFAERGENAFSPRLSILHAVTSNVSLTASIYRAFRSPTLNELYRGFRVGNVVTNANSQLRAERLTGAEAGANVFAFNRRLNLRGNFFWDDIVDPIANVTLSTTPTLITRQRQNLGRTRSRGVDLDAVARLSDAVEVSGGYQFVDATVVQFPADTTLVGLQLPEVPRHQFTLQARYWKPSGFLFSVQGRYSSAQFDDDQNTLKLGRYFTLDLMGGRSLGHGLEAFAAFENLFDERYTVSLSPVPTLGPPFIARVGLRLEFPARR
jgi:outer membrane receptor protein involved in Fe transport